MSKVLVTGGAGYIGSILTETLLQDGHEVIVVDNFMYRQNSLLNVVNSKRLRIEVGDVRNLNLMSSLLKSVDFVIPLAAIVGAPACDRDPELASRVNKSSILDMFKLVQREQRILMPTTNSAYGSGDAQNYCDEESPLNPISLYAKDKVEVESHLMQLHGATSFRLATVFGMSPRMRVDLLVNDFVRKAILDGYVILFESNFKRNYIHVKDVVKAFQMAIKDPDKFAGEIFNVGLSSANVSKKELCERIKKFIPNFVFTESQLKSDPDQRNYIVSNKKLEKLGFRPEFSLDDGIMELIKGIPMLQLRPYTNL